jgi:hypothetical protein
MVIASATPKKKHVLVSKRYPHQLTKEEIHIVASAIAKDALEFIRQQTTMKKDPLFS